MRGPENWTTPVVADEPEQARLAVEGLVAFHRAGGVLYVNPVAHAEGIIPQVARNMLGRPPIGFRYTEVKGTDEAQIDLVHLHGGAGGR